MMQTGNLFDPTPEATYAEVAVPVPAGGTFTYRVPDSSAGLVVPGSRVVVPFSGRRLTGVVVATRLLGPQRVGAGQDPVTLRLSRSDAAAVAGAAGPHQLGGG